MRKIVVIVFLLVGVGLVFYFIKNLNNNLKIYQVEEKQLIRAVYASGYIKPVIEVDIRPEVSGYIEKLYVDEGEDVKKGQILAKIKNDTIPYQIKQIQLEIQKINEKLSENSSFRKNYENQIKIEEEKLNYNQSLLEKRMPLYKKKLVSEEEMQNIKSTINQIKAKINALKSQYNDALEDLNYQKQILEKQKKQLLEELDKYTIKSPVNGKVLKKYLEEGDYVNNMLSTNSIFKIADISKIETVLNVDEEYIHLIKEGQKVLISLDAYPDKVFEGKIFQIIKKSDETTKTVEANIIIEKKKTLAVPISAVYEDKVKVLENGKIVEKPVKIGIKTDGFAEVIEGLKEGDKVILP
jgi:HlyD family secretion protein